MHSQSSQFFLSILIIILLHFCLLTAESPKPRLLITRLVHSDSIYSPYYLKKKLGALVQIDFKDPILSASCLKENSSILPLDIESSLYPRGQSGFLAHLEVGEKRTPQLVYMDTGSSLLWINCEPCCTRILGPLFHPLESSTYKAVDCDDYQNCGALGGASSRCDSKGRCEFELLYGDGNMVMGHIAIEEFKFGATDEIMRDVIFGCAKSTSLFANGVLGLGMSRISLVSQSSSSKFSHCFGNISDVSYEYNTLIIGDGINPMGVQTPMIIEGKYYITLEGIKVGNTLLEIDPQIFIRNPNYTGGMAIDTGSTYTFLPKVALQKFETEIIDLIEFSLTRNYSHVKHGYNMLCYNGILNRDLKGFPTVSFLFKDDATMELAVENIFQQLSNQSFCLAVLPSEKIRASFSVMGNLMMQYFYMVYDLALKKFWFVTIECSVLGDYIY